MTFLLKTVETRTPVFHAITITGKGGAPRSELPQTTALDPPILTTSRSCRKFTYRPASPAFHIM